MKTSLVVEVAEDPMLARTLIRAYDEATRFDAFAFVNWEAIGDPSSPLFDPLVDGVDIACRRLERRLFFWPRRRHNGLWSSGAGNSVSGCCNANPWLFGETTQ